MGANIQEAWILQSTKEYVFEREYEIGKELGRGPTSCVFKCQRRGLPQTWAVKVLCKNTDKKSPKSDIGLLLGLDHKNLIRLKEVFESRTRIFLVQELVTGGELLDRVVNVGDYSEYMATKAVKDIVSGLSYLHRCGYVHRNLKPENLLYENLAADSPLKISDFSLSSVLSPEVDISSVCGSPTYPAPEILKGDRFGPEGDMWTVGVITYILLCGYEPFSDEDPSQLFKKILKGQFSFSSPDWDKIGVNAQHFISKLLVVDSKKRLNAEGALKNCWVNGCGASSTTLDDVVEKMKGFNERRRQKAGIRPLSVYTPQNAPNPSYLILPENTKESVEAVENNTVEADLPLE